MKNKMIKIHKIKQQLLWLDSMNIKQKQYQIGNGSKNKISGIKIFASHE